MPHKFDPARRARLESPERATLLPPETLLRRAGLRPGMRLADIGCGPGFFTLPAADIVGPTGRVFAIDINDELLGLVREKIVVRGFSHIEILRATEPDIPLPDASADVALVAFVMHEAADPKAFAREVARVLTHGGRLLLLEWEKRKMPQGPPPDDRLTPEASEALLSGAGFVTLERFAPNPLHYGLLAVRPLDAPHGVMRGPLHVV